MAVLARCTGCAVLSVVSASTMHRWIAIASSNSWVMNSSPVLASPMSIYSCAVMSEPQPMGPGVKADGPKFDPSLVRGCVCRQSLDDGRARVRRCARLSTDTADQFRGWRAWKGPGDPGGIGALGARPSYEASSMGRTPYSLTQSGMAGSPRTQSSSAFDAAPPAVMDLGDQIGGFGRGERI